MGFLRKNWVEGSMVVASATFYPGAGVNGTGGVVVDWDGDLGYLVQVPAAYLDEVLRRERKRNAKRFLAEVEAFITELRREWPNDMQRAISNRTPTPSLLPVEGAEAHEAYFHLGGGPPVVTATTAVLPNYDSQTIFEPRRRITAVFHLTFWVYWDAIVLLMEGDHAGVSNLLDNLHAQFDIYRRDGFGRPFARAAMAAAAHGAGERQQRRARGE